MKNLNQIAKESIKQLRKNNLFRNLYETSRQDAIHVTVQNRKFISFSCNDYLGLSNNIKTKQAAIDAIEKYGTGAGASRFITGNNPLYSNLEAKLATIKNTQDALVFGSGYLANIGTIPALVGRNDLIIADKLIHACLIDGARLSGAKLIRFSHNQVDKCEYILAQKRKSYNNCLIITEHIFSMDGDVAPINQLYKLANKYNAWLLTDDAHGLGILPAKKSHIQMGTLSKAAGSYGGYVCASNSIIEYLRNKTRSVIYSTALPPAVLASSIAAIDIINNDKELGKKALANAKYFTNKLNLPQAQSTIVPLILKDEEKAIKAAKILEDAGFLVSAIRPPTVPIGTARLRFTFSAMHNIQNIDKLAFVIKQNISYD